MFASLIFLLFAYTAYSILWGKDSAIKFGIVSGIIGLLISCYAMILSLMNNSMMIRLEPLFQVPFVISLIKNKDAWDNFLENDTDPQTLVSSEDN